MNWFDSAHGIDYYKNWFWLNFGWYPGDPFVLFRLSLFEVDRHFSTNRVYIVEVFRFQIAHFLFAWGWHMKDA